MWRNRRLSLNTKLRLYTSLVQFVLLHRSETWTLTEADSARLQAFHMKAQRHILNIKWYDFVTNDSVRSQTKLTDLPLIIADRRHSLLGHVCRLPPDVPAHNILQHCVNLSRGRCPTPDWKRPPGRPRKTWIQQVEEDHGCTIDSLWSSAQDRSLRRSLRPSMVRRSSEWVSNWFFPSGVLSAWWQTVARSDSISEKWTEIHVRFFSGFSLAESCS